LRRSGFFFPPCSFGPHVRCPARRRLPCSTARQHHRFLIVLTFLFRSGPSQVSPLFFFPFTPPSLDFDISGGAQGNPPRFKVRGLESSPPLPGEYFFSINRLRFVTNLSLTVHLRGPYSVQAVIVAAIVHPSPLTSSPDTFAALSPPFLRSH